jgi:hypothetical protein
LARGVVHEGQSVWRRLRPMLRKARSASAASESDMSRSRNRRGQLCIEGGTDRSDCASYRRGMALPPTLNRLGFPMARKVNAALAIPTTVEAELEAYGNMASHNVALFDAARKGKLPATPDFSNDTHRRWRAVREIVVSLVKARDVNGLRNVELRPESSSRSMLHKYLVASVIALQAKGAKAKAAVAAPAARPARKVAAKSARKAHR